MTDSHRGTLIELTSLRFFAAFAIVVLHYRDLLGPLPGVLKTLIVGGQYGVTFFFLLSGFILTVKYHSWFAPEAAGGSYWRFQRLRWARIYPVYLLGLLLDSAVQLAGRDFGGQWEVNWAAWVLNLAGLQSWTPGIPFNLLWNTPSWSISAEMFFYACFPLICGLVARSFRTARALIAGLIGVTIASVLVYALMLHLIYQQWQLRWDVGYSIQYYLPLLRLPEFVAGCLTGRLYLLRRETGGWLASAARRNGLLLLCLALAFARIVMPPYGGPDSRLWLFDNAIKFAWFIVPFAGIILAVACGRTLLSWMLAWPPLVLLGEASYALYITHWTGQSLIQLGLMGSYTTPLTSLIFMALSVVLSVPLYRGFETPMRRWLRGDTAVREL